MDNLYAGPTLRAAVAKHIDGPTTVIVSPDAGGVERARGFAKPLGAGLAIIDKRRSGPNQSEALHIIGDVRDKDCVIVDDMVDTAGTLGKAASALKEGGARRIFAVASHPVLSGPAISRIVESKIEKVFVTDSIPLRPDAVACGKFVAVPIAGVLAEAMRSIHSNDSVSRLFR